MQTHKVKIKYEMMAIFGGRCMLTGVTERNASKLTYHHNNTKNCEDSSRENVTVENGVLLKEFIHCYFLHCVIEKGSKECYELLRQTLNDYKQAIIDNDTEFLQMYEELLMPVFRYFQDNQSQTKRRFRR